MRLMFVIILFALIVGGAKGQPRIPEKIRSTADSINFTFLGEQNISKSQYACGQIFTKSARTFLDCEGLDPKQKKEDNDNSVVFYSLYYILTFTSNSHYVYKINLNPKAVLIDDVELPPCAMGRACDVRIDSLQAIDQAIKSGLDPKFGIMNEGLAVDFETMKFGWQIKNRTKRKADQGIMVWIDAYSGERLKNKDKPWIMSKMN